jgi:protein-disulfide isomerase
MRHTTHGCNFRQVGEDVFEQKTTENVLEKDISTLESTKYNASPGFVVGGQHGEWKISIDKIRQIHKVNILHQQRKVGVGVTLIIDTS